MKVEVEISEEEIKEEIIKYIVVQFARDYQTMEHRYFVDGIKKGSSEAARKAVSENEELIIEKAVDKAAKEISKKALPLLMERLDKEEK